jgi:hypothetical protein
MAGWEHRIGFSLFAITSNLLFGVGRSEQLMYNAFVTWSRAWRRLRAPPQSPASERSSEKAQQPVTSVTGKAVMDRDHSCEASSNFSGRIHDLVNPSRLILLENMITSRLGWQRVKRFAPPARGDSMLTACLLITLLFLMAQSEVLRLY